MGSSGPTDEQKDAQRLQNQLAQQRMQWEENDRSQQLAYRQQWQNNYTTRLNPVLERMYAQLASPVATKTFDLPGVTKFDASTMPTAQTFDPASMPTLPTNRADQLQYGDDWRTVGQRLNSGLNELSLMNLSQAQTQGQGSIANQNARRGLAGSSNESSSMAGLQNYLAKTKAQLYAENMERTLAAEAAARGEYNSTLGIASGMDTDAYNKAFGQTQYSREQQGVDYDRLMQQAQYARSQTVSDDERMLARSLAGYGLQAEATQQERDYQNWLAQYVAGQEAALAQLGSATPDYGAISAAAQSAATANQMAAQRKSIWDNIFGLAGTALGGGILSGGGGTTTAPTQYVGNIDDTWA